MNTSNSLFESYIRSVAASHALGTSGQFVGRKQLHNLCSTSLPDQIQLGGSEYSKTQFLQRLSELLQSGLAAELHRRTTAGDLLPLILWTSHREAFSAAQIAANNNQWNRKNIGASTRPAAWAFAQTAATEESVVSLPSTTPAPAVTTPHALQHVILPPLQCLLEEACFNYIARKLPHILQRKSWALPHDAELNAYTREILVTQSAPFPDPTPIRNLNDIRHVAVHRIPISEEKLFELMEVGLRGTSLLGEWPTLVKIQTLKTRVEKWNEEMNCAEIEHEKAWRRLEHLRKMKREIEEEMSQLEIQVDKNGIKEAKRKIILRVKAEVEDHFASSGKNDVNWF